MELTVLRGSEGEAPQEKIRDFRGHFMESGGKKSLRKFVEILGVCSLKCFIKKHTQRGLGFDPTSDKI